MFCTYGQVLQANLLQLGPSSTVRRLPQTGQKRYIVQRLMFLFQAPPLGRDFLLFIIKNGYTEGTAMASAVYS